MSKLQTTTETTANKEKEKNEGHNKYRVMSINDVIECPNHPVQQLNKDKRKQEETPFAATYAAVVAAEAAVESVETVPKEKSQQVAHRSGMCTSA